jgi:ketosteroid isomerase-like protein
MKTRSSNRNNNFEQMKKALLMLGVWISLLALPNCSPSNADNSQQSPAEEKAILALIEQESRDFYQKNHQAWSQNYIHSPKVHWVCVEQNVTLRANGWEDLSKFVADWMKENPEPMDYKKAQFKNTEAKISIQGDMAFVTFRGSNIQPDGSKRLTIGSRTLLKEAGKWKILSMTSYPSDSPAGSTPNVYLHQTPAK